MIRTFTAWTMLTVLLLVCGIAPAQAQKLSRKAKNAFAATHVGQKFQLRIDLRPFEPYVGAQYVDAQGPHFPNYKQPIMYEALEWVAIDSVGNLGGNFFIVLAKEPGTSDRVVGAQIAEDFAGGRMPGEDAISRASRETLATVELRLGPKASDMTPDDQVVAAEELLTHVFYIDSEPTDSDLVSFVKRHREYPVPVLVEITGLSQARVVALLEEE